MGARRRSGSGSGSGTGTVLLIVVMVAVVAAAATFTCRACDAAAVRTATLLRDDGGDDALDRMRRALEVGDYPDSGGDDQSWDDDDDDDDDAEYEVPPPSAYPRPPTYPDWRFHFPTSSPTPTRPSRPPRPPPPYPNNGGGGGGGGGGRGPDKWNERSNAAACRAMKRRSKCCEEQSSWVGCDNRDVPSGCMWRRGRCVAIQPDEGSPASSCMNRTMGAVVQFRFLDQDFSFWSSNDAFISEAIALRRRHATRIPVFVLRNGRDCDDRAMHPDPKLMAFVDVSAAVCALSPNAVAADVGSFLNSTSQSLWCPWGAYHWRVWPLKP